LPKNYKKNYIFVNFLFQFKNCLADGRGKPGVAGWRLKPAEEVADGLTGSQPFSVCSPNLYIAFSLSKQERGGNFPLSPNPSLSR